MKFNAILRLHLLACAAVGVAAFDASAALLVYDGMPVSGAGAYSFVMPNATKLCGQPPSPQHSSIIGETGIWTDGNSPANYTGTLFVDDAGLSYPDGVFLPTILGALKMYHDAPSLPSGGTGPRTAWRPLAQELKQSFYFSVLMSYESLASYPANEMAVFGLMGAAPASGGGTAYPPATGVQVGFRKNSSGGVDAVLRVLGTVSVIQAGVAPGTHHFVVKLDYNDAGNETIYASLNPGGDEPQVWDVDASAEALTTASTSSFKNLVASFWYPVNKKPVMVDEWRVGDTYNDVCGGAAGLPIVVNESATNIQATSVFLNATMFTTGNHETFVRAHYGSEDGGDDVDAWQHSILFPSSIPSSADMPRALTYQAQNLPFGLVVKYRFSVSNEFGIAFAPETFSAQWLPPELAVYDGFPIFGAGAYSGANAAIWNVTPSHESIRGLSGVWGRRETGVFISSAIGLEYPDGIPLGTQGGALRMTHDEQRHDFTATYTRCLSRVITAPLSETNFYFSVLLEQSGLDYWAKNQFFTIGLTRTQSHNDKDNNTFPPVDGVQIGFKRSTTGVDIVLRAAGQDFVIREDIAPSQTWLIAGKFEYNPAGPDTIRVSPVGAAFEPPAWDVNAEVEVLTPGQTLSWLTVGGCYAMNKGYAAVDEWKTGAAFADVVVTNITAGAPRVITLPVADIRGDTALFNGALDSYDGLPATAWLFYGETDGGADPSEWTQNSNGIPVTAGAAFPQLFATQISGLEAQRTYYYRYAVSNANGMVFSPFSARFLSQGFVAPLFAAPGATKISGSTATLTNALLLAWPEVDVTVCWDFVDRGANSVPSDWAHSASLGKFPLPSALSQNISGLVHNREYWFRFYGTNDVGAAWSAPGVMTSGGPAFSVVDSFVDEGDSGLAPIVFNFSISATSAIPVSVHYATVDDTARAGVNYVAASGEVTIPAGERTASLTLYAIGNIKDEFPGRGFTLNLSSPINATIATASAVGGILDDDMGKRVFADDFSANTGLWVPYMGSQTTGAAGWSYNGSGFYRHSGNNYNEPVSRATIGQDWSNYGVRAMMRQTDTWQWLGLVACHQSGGDWRNGYAFYFGRSDSATGYNANLYTNGVVARKIDGSLGVNIGTDIFRPVSMRVSPTPEGYNRVECFLMFKRIFDFIDMSGDITHGGIALHGGAWGSADTDKIEVFVWPPHRTTLLIVK